VTSTTSESVAVQAALYGIAGQLEYVADFIEADRG
jgi:hypothetical protein